MARYEGLASIRRALSMPDGSALLDIKPEALNWQWARVPPRRARRALACALTAIDGGWKVYISLPDDAKSNVLEIVGLARTQDREPPPLRSGARLDAVARMAAAALSNGALEAWAVTPNGRLFSTWQLNPDSLADWQWSAWFDFLAYRGGLPAPVQQVAMAPLSNGALEAWAVTTDGQLFSTWKENADPSADWAQWFDFLAYRTGLPAPVRQVAMAPLSNGALEAWVVTTGGGLFSTWKESTDPSADWAQWFDFLAYRTGLPAPVQQVAMAPLSNGALEAWVVTTDGRLFSTWKESADPSAEWAQWFDFLAYRTGLPAPVRQVAMAPLSNGALEAWVVTTDGRLFSTWKESADPSADWAPWFDVLAYRGRLPPVEHVAMARSSDGRLIAWVAVSGGSLVTTAKATSDPAADWTPWADFL